MNNKISKFFFDYILRYKLKYIEQLLTVNCGFNVLDGIKIIFAGPVPFTEIVLTCCEFCGCHKIPVSCVTERFHIISLVSV